MSTVPNTNLMTAEELWERATNLGHCELIRGELNQMTPSGGTHSFVGMRLLRALDRFIQDRDLGELTLAETGFRLETNPDTVRAPDIAFIAADRLAQAKTPKFIPIAPDLAVEVNSPNDRAGEVVEKVRWWLTHGTRGVWVVDPKTSTITAYHPDGTARVFAVGQTLDGGEVLPGFTLDLEAFFSE
ncbi:MAG: Uma2 family endonuclease [Planctomycetota bacterium]